MIFFPGNVGHLFVQLRGGDQGVSYLRFVGALGMRGQSGMILDRRVRGRGLCDAVRGGTHGIKFQDIGILVVAPRLSCVRIVSGRCRTAEVEKVTIGLACCWVGLWEDGVGFGQRS